MKLKTLLSTAVYSAMLLASSTLFAQVKVGANPTTIEPASNLEVEASTAGRKMKVDKATGQVSIADGTQGAGKVLTSDVNGGSSWQALKMTAITSFAQASPGVAKSIPTGVAGSFCAAPALGSAPPACATDLNQQASFTTVNATNDIVLDLTGFYSAYGNTSQIHFVMLLYIDKTTPGVFELVDSYYITHTGLSCSGGYMNYKTALKNLPVRSYQVKTYAMNWQNTGTPATIGLGKQSLTGASPCGADNWGNEKIIVSVSQ